MEFIDCSHHRIFTSDVSVVSSQYIFLVYLLFGVKKKLQPHMSNVGQNSIHFLLLVSLDVYVQGYDNSKPIIN